MSDPVDSADALQVSLTVPDVDSVRAVIEQLHGTEIPVRPDGMSVVDPPDASRVRIDVENITPKQWEALAIAHEVGYYERPRRRDLSGVAAELDISKSAVSQRLRAAERRLVNAVLARVDRPVDQ